MCNKKPVLLSMLAVFAILAYGCSSGSSIGPVGSTHKHADIKVYVLGNELDFGQPRYQMRNEGVHFENRDGDVVHTHATGITLGYMFNTLGMNLEEGCITLDTGNEYCSDGNAELEVYIKNPGTEWEQVYSAADYVIQENDKILVSYGTESGEELQQQLDSVTNKAPTT